MIIRKKNKENKIDDDIIYIQKYKLKHYVIFKSNMEIYVIYVVFCDSIKFVLFILQTKLYIADTFY